MLTLHHEFAADKHLSGRAGASLDITRATEGSYVDKAGVLQTAATGVARFDHDPVTHESVGLLVEEARTNICWQSENLRTTWSGINVRDNVDTVNVAVAPDGATTADRIIDDSATGSDVVGYGQNITFATTTPYTYSVFLKAEQLDWAFIEVINLTSLTINKYFDLGNGVEGGAEGADVDSTFIEDFGNGWYRCGITFTTAADTSGTVRLFAATSNGVAAVDRDGTSSILFWGAQVEAGAFPTSYIPTVAASVTRNADVVNTTDVSWFNAAGGTLYATYIPGDVTVTDHRILSLDGGADDRVVDLVMGGTAGFIQSFSSNGVNIQSGGAVHTKGATSMAAIGFIEDDYALYHDGAQIGTDTDTTAVPTPTTFRVGSQYAGGGQTNGHIKELRYYNERLPNDVLEAMSLGTFPPNAPFYIAVTRRTFNGPPKKAIYPKPTRGLFR